MKNFKLSFFSMLVALLFVTACTNDEPVVQDQQQTEESQSISTSLNQLSLQFDQNGNFTADNNPAGNVVFDFCFDFVYPITLSYNNGSTVSVNGLDDLVTVILNSNDELYVNGIAFPFDVEVYDEESDAIVVETINNEEEFEDLIEDCDFDDFEICECFEVYDPVCVEIIDPNGEVFTITYPNSCYAECDGFTEDDFVDTCEDDYSNGPECFELNYPFDIIINGDTVVTINSEEEFGNVLYDVYDFNFVYPFTVTLDNGDVVTVEDEEDVEDLLEECYDDYGGNNECEECEDAGDVPVCIEIDNGQGTEVVVLPNMCYAICLGYSQDDVVECEDDGNPGECEECEDEAIDPVCIEYTTPSGETVIEIFPNLCFAECLGFSEDDVVDCENEADCSEDAIVNALVECVWYSSSSLNPNGAGGIFNFSADGTVSVTLQNSTFTGTWETTSNPSTGEVFMFISLPEPYADISSLDWTVTQCAEGFIALESGNEFLGFEQECD